MIKWVIFVSIVLAMTWSNSASQKLEEATQVEAGSCVDADPRHCQSFFAAGGRKCAEPMAYMLCRKTCGRCGECMDVSKDCQNYDCSKPFFKNYFCRKTCNEC